MARKYLQIEMHPNGRALHTEHTFIECDAPGCDNSVRISESYGFGGLFVAMTGLKAINAFSAEDIEDLEHQDFCCSVDCALAALDARAEHFCQVWAEKEAAAPYQVGTAERVESGEYQPGVAGKSTRKPGAARIRLAAAAAAAAKKQPSSGNSRSD